MSGDPTLDDFESISSTNLTIKSTLTSLNKQSSHKSITKTISPQPKQQSTKSLSKTAGNRDQERSRERSNSSVRRQERGSAQSSNKASMDNSSQNENENELKHVFAKLQSMSVAQKLREHLDEEEEIEARPAKEKMDDEVDGTSADCSSANLKSKSLNIYCPFIGLQ